VNAKSREILIQKGDKFIVTGVTITGQRFKKVFDSFMWADGINLWRGSVWLLRNGKRTLLKRVWN